MESMIDIWKKQIEEIHNSYKLKTRSIATLQEEIKELESAIKLFDIESPDSTETMA